MSKHFPNWEEADIALTRLITEKFHFFVRFDPASRYSIQIGFLKFEDIASYVQENEMNTFAALYTQFIADTADDLGVFALVKEYLFEPSEESTLLRMEQQGNIMIRNFDKRKGRMLTDILLRDYLDAIPLRDIHLEVITSSIFHLEE